MMAPTMRARTAKPPTAPPIMAPMGVLEPFAGVLVEAAPPPDVVAVEESPPWEPEGGRVRTLVTVSVWAHHCAMLADPPPGAPLVKLW